MIQTRQLTLDEALYAARETRSLEVGQAILGGVPRLFRKHFADIPGIIVADKHTYEAAGRCISNAFRDACHTMMDPFIFLDDDLHAEFRFVERLESALRQHRAIPIAVGSGTINDLVKLVAHRTGRQYLCVATAASMDGYTAYGASIIDQGSKQTFDCPAPIAVVADLDVIAAAPDAMKAWGYADLLAKVTAGGDWIVADLLGVEAIDPVAWNIVQGGLHDALSSPALVRSGDIKAIRKLVEGLMLGGFAMQAMRSSRPASGAEHQFSHLWDMQHHTHRGHPPSHGQKVGIGTLAVASLYDHLLAQHEMPVEPSTAALTWPARQAAVDSAVALFDDTELQSVAAREVAAKYIDSKALLGQLEYLRNHWQELSSRLRKQLIPSSQMKRMLAEVGASIEPEQIGISRDRLRRSFRQAWAIRRRFTVLDLVQHMGILEPVTNVLLGETGQRSDHPTSKDK